MEEYKALLKGAYDLHVHSAPSLHARSLDDIEALKEMEEVGMGGAVIKSHYECTATRVELVNKYVDTKARLYGCLTLNASVGGFNPSAVEFALKMGTKEIFLPTNHTKNFFARSKNKEAMYSVRTKEELTIWNDEGKIHPEIYEIIDLVKEYDAILQTGHISEEESIVVAKEACARGAKVVVTHVDSISTHFPLEMQEELVKAGAYIDKNYRCLMTNRISLDELMHHFKVLGTEHCIITTDLGQASAGIKPVAGLAKMAQILVEAGLPADEFRKMACDNTKYLLALA